MKRLSVTATKPGKSETKIFRTNVIGCANDYIKSKRKEGYILFSLIDASLSIPRVIKVMQ